MSIHEVLLTTSQTFNDNIEKINSMPEFFRSAVDWGIEASYKAMGFMALMVLVIKLFK